MRKESGYFDSESEEGCQTSVNTPPCVRKLLPQANPLMSKQDFSPYECRNLFPGPCEAVRVPAELHEDPNHMALLQESTFQQELLRKQLAPAPPPRYDLPTLHQYFADRTPVYERCKPQTHCPYFATYLVPLSASKSIAPLTQSKLPSMVSKKPFKGIQFESRFESGNLWRAYGVDALSFELVVQNDINTRGNNQWFFFSVRGVPAGATLHLRILNMAKQHSLFTSGMKPVIYSTQRYEKRGIAWVREGIKVAYLPGYCRKDTSNQPYYTLSFSYKFAYENDVVYFSYAIPYSLTDLNLYLKNELSDRKKHQFLNIRHLGTTLGGHELQVFELTNKSSRETKRVVWIFGRQHSGQVTGSFMMEGIITFLMSDCEEVRRLRDLFVFKIVPMVNVDGVVHGNTRAELGGCDPNRQWVDPSPVLHAGVCALRKAILRDGDSVEMVLDLHSHSRKCGTFFYGNYDKTNTRSKVFPWLVARADPRFDYDGCRFTGGSEAAARRALHSLLSTPYIYTVESSFYGYRQPNTFKVKNYTPQDYREMGVTLMRVLATMRVTCDNPQEPIFEGVEEDKESVGSDEDPCVDQISTKELQRLVPPLTHKKKKKNLKKPLRDNLLTPIVKQPVKSIEKYTPQRVKIDKESYYRKYFSGRCSNKIIKELKIEASVAAATQTQFGQQSLKPRTSLNNLTSRTYKSPSVGFDFKELLHLRSTMGFRERLIQKGLCVYGQQLQDQITIVNNSVGIQTDVIQNIFVHRNKRNSCQQVRRHHNQNKLFGDME